MTAARTEGAAAVCKVIATSKICHNFACKTGDDVTITTDFVSLIFFSFNLSQEARADVFVCFC